MNKMNLYIRYPLKNIPTIFSQFLQIRLKSDKKDSDTTAEASKGKNKNNEALNKLNLLLKQIVEDDIVINSASSLQLAKPKSKKKDTKQEPKTDSVETQVVEKDIISSVKNVADSLGGNKKQTESELLSKLLNPVDVNSSDKQTISTNLSDIVKGMKIDRSRKREDISRAHQVKNILRTTKGSKDPLDAHVKSPNRRARNDSHFIQRERQSINLFGKAPLGIFSDISQYPDNQMNKTWQRLYDRELRLAITNPPANYFQQMILWTEQGKLWKFPIDNEQDMVEEQNIYFTEHVFLEKHLDPWCPPKGPIRHFMELVCVGMSKNPYMSVEHKQEHIAWFRDYFLDKKKLLEEVGAIPAKFDMKSSDREVKNEN